MSNATASITGLRVGNTPRLTFKFQDGGTALDISAATTLQAIITRPTSSTLTVTLTFTTDGTDGLAYYDVQTTDLSEEGEYKAQGKYVDGSNTYTSDHHEFIVGGNLS